MGSQAEKIKLLKEKRSKLENWIDREKDAYKKCLERTDKVREERKEIQMEV